MSSPCLVSRAEVSVVVPTIGRPRLLRDLLASLAACDPAPSEILVVDQTSDGVSQPVVEQYAAHAARIVPCDGSGVARARNVGLERASHEIVLYTDDDCTVARDWVGRAVGCMRARPEGIVTGRVLPAGDPNRVPSTKQHTDPREYTGQRVFDVLFSGNMAVPRSLVLELGGFDEALSPADDNDLCYRWLRAGFPLRYEPAMVVWHRDWRTASALDRLAVDYARGQGAFYGKHVRRGDMRMLAFAARDLSAGLRGTAATWARGRRDGFDWRLGVLRGLPRGFVKGLRLAPSGGSRA
jgi:GT2 family glycosyltransferase